MSASFYDLLKYAKTGIASPSMTYYDKLRASTLMGGVAQTLTGIPPLSFKSDGTPLISWSMKGNGIQTGTPTPDNPMMPEFVGVRTGNLVDDSKVTQNAYINASTGITGSSSASNTTDYIDINASPFAISGVRTTDLRNSGSRGICYFDSNKNYIAGYSYGADVMTRPVIVSQIQSNVRYVRFTFDKAFENGIMLNLGSTALPYEPFGYKIPITCAGQTVPVYLGQTRTVRKIKKVVLTGEEANWYYYENATSTVNFFYLVITRTVGVNVNKLLNTHGFNMSEVAQQSGNILIRVYAVSEGIETVEEWKAYLAAQYAAGTPVTVWYVLATPETGIVNEPLAKIGDYCDELHSEDASVTIPTVKGQNVLTVDTPIQPSEMSITYKG